MSPARKAALAQNPPSQLVEAPKTEGTPRKSPQKTVEASPKVADSSALPATLEDGPEAEDGPQRSESVIGPPLTAPKRKRAAGERRERRGTGVRREASGADIDSYLPTDTTGLAALYANAGRESGSSESESEVRGTQRHEMRVRDRNMQSQLLLLRIPAPHVSACSLLMAGGKWQACSPGFGAAWTHHSCWG